MSNSQAHVSVAMRYAAITPPAIDDTSYRLQIPTDAHRGPVGVSATLRRPGVVRDALLTVADIVASDLRFKATDRSDYLAYLLKQGKRATKELWDAQKAFLDARYAEEIDDERPLDPIVTVTNQGISIEGFSTDESAYARLDLPAEFAYDGKDVQPGTTHIAFTPELLQGLTGMRSYRSSIIELSPSERGEEHGEERQIRVPHRWIRAFGQVQAASTLPATTFEVAPIDLYNVLFTLRMHRAKHAPRALRYELIPGQVPRMVLEPWDLALQGTGAVYKGDRPQVVRTWGRRRLSLLSRLLPHVKSVKIKLVGVGLPAYYILDLGGATLTLALSGWTDSGWAGIATFDLLVPGTTDQLLTRQVLEATQQGGKSLAELQQSTGRDRAECRDAVLAQLQRGAMVHDVATGTFAARPLLAQPVDPELLRYRDEREQAAHRLLEVQGQVQLTKIHDLGREGVRIEGEVSDRQAHRTYNTSFTIDREGRTVKAECSSPQFRRAGLREGPTVPMIAIRLQYARQQAALERARGTEAGRKLIRAETRTLTRRTKSGSTTYRVSLNEQEVLIRWGSHPDEMRMNRLLFSTTDEARIEYFSRLQQYADKGFIDSSAAEAI